MENSKFVTEEELRQIIVNQFEMILDITASVEALVIVLKENHSLPANDFVLARQVVDQSAKYGKSRELLRELREAGSLEDFLRKFQGTVQ